MVVKAEPACNQAWSFTKSIWYIEVEYIPTRSKEHNIDSSCTKLRRKMKCGSDMRIFIAILMEQSLEI